MAKKNLKIYFSAGLNITLNAHLNIHTTPEYTLTCTTCRHCNGAVRCTEKGCWLHRHLINDAFWWWQYGVLLHFFSANHINIHSLFDWLFQNYLFCTLSFEPTFLLFFSPIVLLLWQCMPFFTNMFSYPGHLYAVAARELVLKYPQLKDACGEGHVSTLTFYLRPWCTAKRCICRLKTLGDDTVTMTWTLVMP